MDILDKRTIEITTLALDGLAARHKAISSNVANAESQDYRKLSVNFEDQLQRILDTDNRQEQNKLDNMLSDTKKPFTPGKNDLSFKDFKPQTIISEGAPGTNNVNIESEMADLSKTGLMYDALATLQQKAFQEMKDIIERGGRG